MEGVDGAVGREAQEEEGGAGGQGGGRITISYDTNFMSAILVTVNFDL